MAWLVTRYLPLPKRGHKGCANHSENPSHAPTSGRRPRILHGMRSLQTRLSIRCEPGALSVRTISSPASSAPRDGNNPAGPKAIEIGGLSNGLRPSAETRLIL